MVTLVLCARCFHSFRFKPNKICANETNTHPNVDVPQQRRPNDENDLRADEYNNFSVDYSKVGAFSLVSVFLLLLVGILFRFSFTNRTEWQRARSSPFLLVNVDVDFLANCCDFNSTNFLFLFKIAWQV